MPTGVDPPSAFVVAQRDRLRETIGLGPCLDLACGRGRHALWAARAGLRVIGLDRDAEALGALALRARAESLPVHPLRADAESGAGLPFRPACFGAVLVTRFLFRPLAAQLPRLLAPGGLLVYETFTKRQQELPQGPRNPAFLLDEAELPRLFPALDILAAHESRTETPFPAWLAGLAARKRSAQRAEGERSPSG